MKAGELAETATLADYLKREDAVFAALKEKVPRAVPAEDRRSGNRYSAGGPLDPTRLGAADGNRTFELAPETIQGGALLLHGLTDSPYSVRPIAETLRKLGYYTLAPRMPGHGTAPSGLVSAEWQDWMSVVRLAARHVRATTGAGKPFVLVGYSNGGALAVKYAQDVLEGSGLPRPDRIVLMSPMIGVTPFAGFARVASLLHLIPFFEKNAWLDVVPEYNPYKYNSFPANAGHPDVEAHEGAERADRAPRGGRPAEGPRARPHVPVARRRDRLDRRDRPPALRPAPRERERARPLRHQPREHARALPQAARGEAPRAI